ncbi:MAG: hypothetical protein DRP47_02170 [Candidatus Zixiibacteriota bacterium]|nr:MAG: hypothetical protein DRP47_02170 [candidate division Zixibacteria bacterium]
MRTISKQVALSTICWLLPAFVLAAPPNSENDTSISNTLTDTSNDTSDRFDYPVDPLFDEIILTPEGVIAVDTGGLEWYYDFEADTFIEGVLPSADLPSPEQLMGDDMAIEDRCTEERWIGTLEKTVLIGYDEYVDGDIVAYGRVTIRGWVKGDVKSMSGRVLITGSGRVDGNVEAPRVVVKKGGVVSGERIESESPLDLDDFTSSFSADGLVVAIVFTVSLLFFCFLFVELMPRQVRQLQDCVVKHGIKTYLLGLLFVLLLPVVIALVAITIVGLLAVPFIPLIYLGAFILGEVVFGNMIGKLVMARSIGGERNMLFQSILGVFLHMSLWSLTAILLGQQNRVAEGFGIFFLVVAIIITTFPVFSGLGAAILTRFGFRNYISWKDHRQWEGETPAPAPPPLRQVPPVHPPDVSRPPDHFNPPDNSE